MTAGAGPGPRVLVIDDEPQIRRLLSVSLSSRGYRVDGVSTGQEGIERVATGAFDVLLLDLGLPDMDGLVVCQEVRRASQVPIIVLSVREDERDKIAALDLGADDYVTKPFSIEELLARIRASLRRVAPAPDSSVLTVGPLTVDPDRRRVTRDGEEVRLTPTEYDLLRVLSLHAGRVLTHRQLLRQLRGPSYEEDTPLLRVYVVTLRQKLGIPSGLSGYIATEPGVGYRLLE